MQVRMHVAIVLQVSLLQEGNALHEVPWPIAIGMLSFCSQFLPCECIHINIATCPWLVNDEPGRPIGSVWHAAQEVQGSIRMLDRVMRKVDAPAASSQGESYFRSVAETVSAFAAAAAQARVLREAAVSPAAELLQVGFFLACPAGFCKLASAAP